MTRIKQTETFPQDMVVEANCYHLKRGETRIRVPRQYMVSDKKDGSGMQEYLLTRYVNKLGVAMSSILKVKPNGDLEEVCREDRKHEEQMIMAWCTQKGGTECEPEAWN